MQSNKNGVDDCCIYFIKFRLEMEDYFIHMAVTAELTVAHSTRTNFMHSYKCMESYLSNGITNIGIQIFSCA